MQVMNSIINTNPNADRSNGNGHNIQWNSRKPMEPMTKPAARKFGIIPIKAKLTDLKRNKNITKLL